MAEKKRKDIALEKEIYILLEASYGGEMGKRKHFQSEDFVVRSGLMGRLSMKRHEELLALLEQLIQQQPDLEPRVETLIELPLASALERQATLTFKWQKRQRSPIQMRRSGSTKVSYKNSLMGVDVKELRISSASRKVRRH